PFPRAARKGSGPPWGLTLGTGKRGYTSGRHRPLAQLVEQGTLNPKVAGSIPARPISRGRLGGRPRELWFLGLVRRAWAGRWAVVHVCPAAGRPVPRTCPRLPEQQREQDAHETHAHQDPADGVDVDAARGSIHGKRQDRADRDQEDSNSESHRSSLSSFQRTEG